MIKIPTIFVRGPKHLVTTECNNECLWVFHEEGIATQKFDGTCCMVRNHQLYKRVTWDPQKGPAPPEWLHHDFNPLVRSGHGWLPVGIGPEDWMHRSVPIPAQDGTYELCGPKIGRRNPEHLNAYVLLRHGGVIFPDAPRTYDELETWLAGKDIEGIVWHHQDGRMAKIKGVDFGLKRGA